MKKKYIPIWKCPKCKYKFARNPSGDCPKCGQFQLLGEGWQLVSKEYTLNKLSKLKV